MANLKEQAESLQNLLVAHATGSSQSEPEYRQLRDLFLSDPQLAGRVPSFVRTCRNLSQFWEFIKYKFGTYRDRRTFLWEEFEPLLVALDNAGLPPSDDVVSEVLDGFESPQISAAWAKALDRRQADPEGAITMARTLLESVCKHILEETGTDFEDSLELPKLYKLAAEAVNLAPSQHTETVFRQILGGCTAVVEGLGALRNRLSDSHGTGKRPVRPAARHAELAVNLAGATAQFLIATLQARHEPAA